MYRWAALKIPAEASWACVCLLLKLTRQLHLMKKRLSFSDTYKQNHCGNRIHLGSKSGANMRLQHVRWVMFWFYYGILQIRMAIIYLFILSPHKPGFKAYPTQLDIRPKRPLLNLQPQCVNDVIVINHLTLSRIISSPKRKGADPPTAPSKQPKKRKRNQREVYWSQRKCWAPESMSGAKVINNM